MSVDDDKVIGIQSQKMRDMKIKERVTEGDLLSVMKTSFIV